MWGGKEYVKDKDPGVVEITVEAQSWVDAINQADCMEDLHAVGDNLKGESPEVQNAVRPFYAKKLKDLKTKK